MLLYEEKKNVNGEWKLKAKTVGAAVVITAVNVNGAHIAAIARIDVMGILLYEDAKAEIVAKGYNPELTEWDEQGCIYRYPVKL